MRRGRCNGGASQSARTERQRSSNSVTHYGRVEKKRNERKRNHRKTKQTIAERHLRTPCRFRLLSSSLQPPRAHIFRLEPLTLSRPSRPRPFSILQTKQCTTVLQKRASRSKHCSSAEPISQSASFAASYRTLLPARSSSRTVHSMPPSAPDTTPKTPAKSSKKEQIHDRQRPRGNLWKSLSCPTAQRCSNSLRPPPPAIARAAARGPPLACTPPRAAAPTRNRGQTRWLTRLLGGGDDSLTPLAPPFELRACNVTAIAAIAISPTRRQPRHRQPQFTTATFSNNQAPPRPPQDQPHHHHTNHHHGQGQD